MGGNVGGRQKTHRNLCDSISNDNEYDIQSYIPSALTESASMAGPLSLSSALLLLIVVSESEWTTDLT